jgi:hypothetical protein
MDGWMDGWMDGPYTNHHNHHNRHPHQHQHQHQQVQALLQPGAEGEAPLIMPVLEGQRLIQALKQELAARSVGCALMFDV